LEFCLKSNSPCICQFPFFFFFLSFKLCDLLEFVHADDNNLVMMKPPPFEVRT
jgi:hypothetical protein